MKRKFLLALLIATITCTFSQAQIKKGSILLGGSVSFATTKENRDAPMNDGKYIDISISPAWGKAIKDNLIIGADILYGFQEYTPSDPYSQSSRNRAAGAGLFIRKYISLGKGFYLFGQGRFGANYFDQKYESFSYSDGTFTVKGYSANVSFYPGLSYAINNKLHVETGFTNLVNVSFSHSKTTKPQLTGSPQWKSNSFGISSSLSNLSRLSIGLRLLLSKA